MIQGLELWETPKYCPECRECSKHLETHRPYEIPVLLGVGICTSILGGVAAPLVLFGLLGQFSEDWRLNVFGFGWSLGGAFVLSSIVTMVALGYWFAYRPHNVIGYMIEIALYPDRKVHAHLSKDNPERQDRQCVLYVPIKGGTHSCSISLNIYDDYQRRGAFKGQESSHEVFFNAEKGFLLKGFSEEIRTRSPATVLWTIFHNKSVREMACDVTPAYLQFLTELKALELMTGIDDPLGHGRSKHGKFVYQRVTNVVRKWWFSIADNDQATKAARKIVDDLIAERQQSTPTA